MFRPDKFNRQTIRLELFVRKETIHRFYCSLLSAASYRCVLLIIHDRKSDACQGSCIARPGMKDSGRPGGVGLAASLRTENVAVQ